MAMDNIRVGSFGHTIEITLTQDSEVFDASSFSTVTFWFKAPGIDAVEKDAAFKTDGSDGVCSYTTVDGLFSVDGGWQVWVLLVKTDTSIPCVKKAFTVDPA